MDKQKNRHQEKWQEEIIHSTEKAFNKDTHFMEIVIRKCNLIQLQRNEYFIYFLQCTIHINSITMRCSY